jgi:starch synthase
VGGIKEVVVDGETGFLVPLEQHTQSPFEALDPDKFARDLAEKINVLMRDRELQKRFGQAGRRRALEKFSWHAIAAATKQMYGELIEKNKAFGSSVATT